MTTVMLISPRVHLLLTLSDDDDVRSSVGTPSDVDHSLSPYHCRHHSRLTASTATAAARVVEPR